ncbi:MAG: hypothetical protein ACXVHK_32680, partial [Solirubrobacteraceae bacterium]
SEETEQRWPGPRQPTVHRRPVASWLSRIRKLAVAPGQREPRARPTPAWSLSAAGGNAWTVKPRMRKVAETIVRFGYPALSKAVVSDPRGIGGVPA